MRPLNPSKELTWAVLTQDNNGAMVRCYWFETMAEAQVHAESIDDEDCTVWVVKAHMQSV